VFRRIAKSNNRSADGLQDLDESRQEKRKITQILPVSFSADKQDAQVIMKDSEFDFQEPSDEKKKIEKVRILSL
jgi:hypothetical protein